MKRASRNPFPGVTRATDRHGKVRWRFRMKGRPDCYLPGTYGSVEFRTAYEDARVGGTNLPVVPRAPYGTFDWLIEHYIRTPKWQKLAAISRRNLLHEMDRFRTEHGTKRVKNLRPEHVEALIARKAATPAGANRLLKLIRRLCRFAIRKGVITVDPSIGAERYAENPDGFHTWTEDEIVKFEAHHGAASKPVLALRLILNTGAARQDVIRLGRQSVRGGRIGYRRGKTGGDVDLPIMSDLVEVLAAVPADQLLFLTHGAARPYKPETFGNWFRDQCIAAGLPHCSSHGLRKAGATRLANAGANALEIMAFLGHRTPAEAQTYIKKADRKQLADRGMGRLESAKQEQNLSNQVEKLDNRRRKQLKEKGN
ncbi:tyrosine-type recombinase/integrase [Mesorhizobium sp. B1-1-7]|uniref:tyrosine-type recombinase/integrase n=1 Tax=Mesorhizobium sp. B1-1-7 TaxID=2589977 RepID=UPI00112697B1|nr:tyrosine-type recombinase/integrase [Mesorhizobium sp. B1-1-7]TPN49356.1 integrase [Mesorhizobium sp. B1-1-7]